MPSTKKKKKKKQKKTGAKENKAPPPRPSRKKLSETALHAHFTHPDGSWWLINQPNWLDEDRGGDTYTGLNKKAYDEEHAQDRTGGSAVWTSNFEEAHLCDLYWEEEFGFLLKDLPTLRFLLLPTELRLSQEVLIENGDALIKFLECMCALDGTERVIRGCADQLHQLYFNWWSRGVKLGDLPLITQVVNFLNTHMGNGMRMPDEWFGIRDSLQILQKAFLPIAQAILNETVEALLRVKMGKLEQEIIQLGSDLLGDIPIMLSVKSNINASIMPTKHELKKGISQIKHIANAMGMPKLDDISSMMGFHDSRNYRSPMSFVCTDNGPLAPGYGCDDECPLSDGGICPGTNCDGL